MADSKSSTDSKSDTMPESQTSADIKSDTVPESQTSTESTSISASGSQTSAESKSYPVPSSTTSSEERKPMITNEPTSQTSSGSNEGVSGISSAIHAPTPRGNPMSSIASTGSPPIIDRSDEIERLGSASVSPIREFSSDDDPPDSKKISKYRALWRYANGDRNPFYFAATISLVACITLTLLYLYDKWIAFQYVASIFGGIILGVLTICGCGLHRFRHLNPTVDYTPIQQTSDVEYKSRARRADYNSPTVSLKGFPCSSSEETTQPKVTGTDASTFVTTAEITHTDRSETEESAESVEEPVRQRHPTSDEELEQLSINV